MKKTILACFMGCLLLLPCLTGCGKKADAGGYRIYTTNAERGRLQTENYSTQSVRTDDILQEIMDRMKTPTASLENYSILPEGVEIQGCELTDGQLTVTFNDAYLSLSKADEMLLRAGTVLTMTQIPDVRTVVFHIESDVLRDFAGEPVGAMTGSMFLNTQVGKNSYQYASLALYFSNSKGDRIVRETRNVHYSSNTTLEKVVMEQLLRGPMSEQLNPIMPEGVTVLDISVEDNTCTLNVSKEFLDVRGDDSMSPEVGIYAVVDTLCDVLRVERVQFQVEGQSNVLYKEKLSLSGPFHRNSELIEVQENLQDPSAGSDGQTTIGL